MKTAQSFRIHFVLRAYLAKNGKAPLYVSVTVNKEKCLIGLKQSIDLNNWDTEKGIPKGNREQVKVLNSYLDEVKLALGNCHKELMLKGRLPSATAVKNLYLGEADEGFTLSKLFTYHNESSTEDLKWSTLKHYYVTQRYLVKFLGECYKVSDIYLRELNYKFVKDFEVYLRNHKPKDHQKPLANNGVMKHIIRLKKMVNLAQNLRWIDNDPFATYKLKMQKVNREQLSEVELKSIENKKLPIERLDMVRDMFVFSCYTGLAYVDMINLTPEHIIAGTDGDRWIRTCREKTLIPVNVPLNKGSGITAKEAFNLMEGRAVHKQLYNLEGHKYQAWLTLDDKNLTDNGNKKIKHYHENYGYEIDKVIAGKGIKELDDPKSKEDLMRPLRKGNAQQVTVDRDGAEQKYFMTANPQYKTVDLYDHQMKKIKREEVLQPEQKATKSLKQREQPTEELPKKSSRVKQK